MLKTYKIFRRQASINGQDKRVRWHVVAEQVGWTRTNALKRFFGPGMDVKAGETVPDGLGGNAVAPVDGWYDNDGTVFIPKRAYCVPDWNGVPTLAWESGTVDFEFYNLSGTLVPGYARES
jgi:hypothetical protein